MSSVSYNRVVNVDVSVSDRFPTVANFNQPLIIDPDTAADTTLAADVVKKFSSLEEMVIYGFPITSPAYLAAQAMAATEYAPRTFYVGHYATSLLASLTAIAAIDNGWYIAVLSEDQEFADSADLLGGAPFLTDNRKVLFFQSLADPLIDDPASAVSLASTLRAAERMVGFYAGAAGEYKALKAAAYVSSVNYNNPNSHYTLKFKELTGEPFSNISDTQAQNLTGFIPGTGLDAVAGGFLNAYICTAGLNFVVEGITTNGDFVDLLTFSDWLVATMQRNVLGVFTNNKVVPYDVTGLAMLYGAVAFTLDSGVLSGALTEQRLNSAGDLLPAYTIDVQDISSVAAALQAQRIAPEIQFCGRYAGAVHYVDVTGILKVAN